jgi:hypothetical protein
VSLHSEFAPLESPSHVGERQYGVVEFGTRYPGCQRERPRQSLRVVRCAFARRHNHILRAPRSTSQSIDRTPNMPSGTRELLPTFGPFPSTRTTLTRSDPSSSVLPCRVNDETAERTRWDRRPSPCPSVSALTLFKRSTPVESRVAFPRSTNQDHPGSTCRQSALHPSPESVLPSSHASRLDTSPSPQ